MTKTQILFFGSIIIVLSLSTLAPAQTVSSLELINNAKSYDRKIIEYKGEVIGDTMRRQDFVWVNLNDGDNAIGVWMAKELAGQIRYRGNYQFHGDIITVRGIFNQSCPEHGGDMDIHAQGTISINTGRPLPHAIPPLKIKIALMLGCALILTLLVFGKYIIHSP